MAAWLGAHLLGTSKIAPDGLAGLGMYILLLIAVVLFAYGFYRLFEARTADVRRTVKGLALRPAGPARHARINPDGKPRPG